MARKRTRTVVRDLGFTKLRERLVSLGKPYVTIGVHQEDRERTDEDGGSSPSMALVASVHEFGTEDGRVPERSYIRSTMDGRRGEIADIMQKIEAKVAEGALTAEQGVGLLGEFLQGAVQKTLTDLRSPPLKASTIKRRRNGGDNPLIDTGQLRAAIRYEVQTGERPEEDE